MIRPETSLIQQHLCPDGMRALAVSLPLTEFVAGFAGLPILLVQLDDRAAELESGLATLKTQPTQAQPELNVLAFRTLLGDIAEPSRATSRETDPVTAGMLRQRLMQARHFAVTIEKRAVEASYAHRIAVGRARNKDVVLRHPSVSKFHAWFEHDPQLGLRVADANSSNGTRKNGSELKARELTEVRTGDVLRFGSVEVVLCDAEALWRALST